MDYFENYLPSVEYAREKLSNYNAMIVYVENRLVASKKVVYEIIFDRLLLSIAMTIGGIYFTALNLIFVPLLAIALLNLGYDLYHLYKILKAMYPIYKELRNCKKNIKIIKSQIKAYNNTHNID
jgi:hypothetical protein